MICLNIFSVILSGLGLGFGIVILKAVKSVKIWGVPIAIGTVARRLRCYGGGICSLGVILFLLSIALIYKSSANHMLLFIALYIFLWMLSLIIGAVCGDFASAKHRDFSKDNFCELSELSALKTAEKKSGQGTAVVVGFEGIAFIDKDGRLLDVLFFGDFGLEDLSRSVETDILCQYFNSIKLSKEIHGVSNKLSSVFNMKTSGGKICIAQNAEKNMQEIQ